MAVEMVSEVEHDARLRLVPAAEPIATPAMPEQRPEPVEFPAPRPVRPIFPSREVLDVMEFLAKALSLRLLLFAGFAVTAVLGYLVVAKPSVGNIVALCLWALIAYIPVVLLNARQS